MKAAFFMQHGGPEVLQYGDVPDPAAGAGELLVDVHAASVNAADWKMRAGNYAPVSHFPYVPGRDFSGVVAALGEGAGDFEVGDPVSVSVTPVRRVHMRRRSRSRQRSWRGSLMRCRMRNAQR